MRFQPLFALAAAFSTVRALQLTNGVLRTSQGDQHFSVGSPAQPVVLDAQTTKLEVSFDLEGTKRIPDQIFVKLTTKQGVETSFKPVTSVDNNVFSNKLTLTYSKLPTVFAASPEIDISIVAGDVSDDKPILASIGQIKLANELVAGVTYTKAEKFGPKPEIHHIFQSAPKTVNGVIALVFVSLSIACLVAIIGAWASQGALNFKNFPGVDVNHLAFIGLIIAYEAVFFQYYLGCTIFQTIFRVLALLGPSLWFGSRVLNHVGALRLAGKN